MENNPMIPSNYVTLSQLQERWLKQKEQRKLKENEPHATKQPNNEETQPKIEAPKLKQQPPPENHRSGGNRSYKKSVSAAASPEVPFVCAVSVVEGNQTEITVDETNKSLDLGANMKKKKWEKRKMMKKTNQEEKEKRMEDGGTGTQGEEEAMVRETHAPPAISEKKNKSARRFPRRRDLRFDYRPKNIRSVEKSDHAVEIEGKVQDATEKSDLTVETEAEVQEETETSDLRVEMEAEVQQVTEKSEDIVEIETKLGDLCIEVGSYRSATQNNTSNRRNGDCTGDNTSKHSSSGYRSRDRIVNYSSRTISRRNSDYIVQNGVSDRRSTAYRGRGGGGYWRYGHYRENSERFNGNGRVWVKKGEVAVGSDDA